MSLIRFDSSAISAAFIAKDTKLVVYFNGSIPANTTDVQLVLNIENFGGRNFNLVGTKGPGNPSPPVPLKKAFFDQWGLNGTFVSNGKLRISSIGVWVLGASGDPERISVKIIENGAISVPSAQWVAVSPPSDPNPDSTPLPTPNTVIPNGGTVTTNTPAVPKFEILPALDAKLDPSSKVLAPINTSLPAGKFFVRITTSAVDASSTRYDVEAKPQDDALRVVRSGVKGGSVYWDLSWNGAPSVFVSSFSVTTTRDKGVVIVQPYAISLITAP